MAHPIKNLMVKIHDLLVADSDVLAIFKGDSGDIRYNTRPSVHQISKKPYISIDETDDDNVFQETATREPRIIKVLVSYCYDDKPTASLDHFTDLEKIEAVLRGSGLRCVEFGSDKAYREVDGHTSELIQEAGYLRRQYTLLFKYNRQK